MITIPKRYGQTDRQTTYNLITALCTALCGKNVFFEPTAEGVVEVVLVKHGYAVSTVENDLKEQNLGLWSAWHRAYDSQQWRENVVETATLRQGQAT